MTCIIIPTNIFVYGTSDTSYVDTVSSTIAVEELQVAQEAEKNSNEVVAVSNKARTLASTEETVTVVKNEVSTVTSGVANVLGMEYTEDDSAFLILGDGLADYDIAILSTDSEDVLNDRYSELGDITSANLSTLDVVDVDYLKNTTVETVSPYSLVINEDTVSYSGPSISKDTIGEYHKGDRVTVTNVEVDGYVLINNDNFDEWILKSSLCTHEEFSKAKQGDALLDIDNPDESYFGHAISLTSEDRDLLERLVMGEAGNQGVEGAALVAQCIRDTMYYKGVGSVAEVREGCKYSGSISKEPNQDVLDAVSFIFDDGGYAVRHKVFYFYAPKHCVSSWHETRPFIIEYGGHRIFA